MQDFVHQPYERGDTCPTVPTGLARQQRSYGGARAKAQLIEPVGRAKILNLISHNPKPLNPMNLNAKFRTPQPLNPTPKPLCYIPNPHKTSENPLKEPFKDPLKETLALKDFLTSRSPLRAPGSRTTVDA